jgi:ABC-type transporter Mla maintaining outer membrane lipid asymmetry permease subunit MlaE
MATVIWIGGIMMILTGIVIANYENKFTGLLDFNTLWSTVMSMKHCLVALMVMIHFYRGLMLNPKIGKLSTKINESKVTSPLSSRVQRLQIFSLDLVKVNL